MINFICNWRKNLFIFLYFLLFINSLLSQTKQMSAEFWIANRYSMGLSCRTVAVQRKKRIPLWIVHPSAKIYFWKRKILYHFKKFSLFLSLSFFNIAIVFCIYLFRSLVIQMNSCGIKFNDKIEINCHFSEFIQNYIPIFFDLNMIIGQNDSTNYNTASKKYYSQQYFNIKDKTNYIEENIIVDKLNNKKLDYIDRLSIIPNIQNKNVSNSGCMHFYVNKKEITFYQTEMKRFYNSLSEKDRRRYAGIEAMKLGHGGRTCISEILGCSTKTVLRGIREIKDLPNDIGKRIRKLGGGRWPLSKHLGEKLDNAFLNVMENHTAGCPMNERILWTNLSRVKISDLLEERFKISASETVIKKMLKAHNFSRRKAYKGQTRKSVKNRNDQFETITLYRIEYEIAGDPIISIDSKKREHLTLYRDGHLYTQKLVVTPDHDFPSYSDGSFVPHGIWDVVKNKGYISIGISKDTSEFACDSLRYWWKNIGIFDYPCAQRILILCDGGGSNSSRSHLFKQDLQKLSDELELEIRIAHYPPYCSKYNPIEHRMFPHVTKACQGVIFENYERAQEYIEKTKTRHGLIVRSEIIEKEYEKGRKADLELLKNLNIEYDDDLKSWNYRIAPEKNRNNI